MGRVVATVAVAAAAGLVGFRLGLASSRNPCPDQRSAGRPLINTLHDSARPDNGPLLRRISELELELQRVRWDQALTKLASNTVVTDAGPDAGLEQSEAPSQRVDFPRTARYAFQPDGFREIFQRSLSECHWPFTVRAVDCEEFPCIVVGQWDAAAVSDIDLSTCKSWRAAYGGRTSVRTFSSGLDGGTVLNMVILPIPDDYHGLGSVLREVGRRQKALLERLRMTP